MAIGAGNIVRTPPQADGTSVMKKSLRISVLARIREERINPSTILWRQSPIRIGAEGHRPLEMPRLPPVLKVSPILAGPVVSPCRYRDDSAIDCNNRRMK